MQGIYTKKGEIIFSTIVLPTSPKEEFIVEFFNTSKLENSPAPVKVTRNFEELIRFFENLEEE
ncbi:hypothetical protein A8F94_02135 [Bacillus sp. FJAT-27225]|uniref:hypothetical protein n=1 Tax=Bacillus sp. FJAT-27225 TaxID=1743144 RepID=UPI00080C2300|nr:hypothetical protein [Bacillus sp. FJAT-27225]OCA90699.1 hypothetical protein A8F94_02135 [Bacillus sp. FJAT-27225]